MFYRFVVRVPWAQRLNFENSTEWLQSARDQFLGLPPFKEIRLEEVTELTRAGIWVVVAIECSLDIYEQLPWLADSGLETVLERNLINCPGFAKAMILRTAESDPGLWNTNPWTWFRRLSNSE